jgi:hypothetical protein
MVTDLCILSGADHFRTKPLLSDNCCTDSQLVCLLCRQEVAATGGPSRTSCGIYLLLSNVYSYFEGGDTVNCNSGGRLRSVILADVIIIVTPKASQLSDIPLNL